MGNSLRLTQIALGLVGTAAALTVTTFTTELGSVGTKVASFIATLCIGTLSAFNIGGKADSMRRAWRHVTLAVIRFRSEPNFSIADLTKAYDTGEQLVGDVPFNTAQLKTNDGRNAASVRPAP